MFIAMQGIKRTKIVMIFTLVGFSIVVGMIYGLMIK